MSRKSLTTVALLIGLLVSAAFAVSAHDSGYGKGFAANSIMQEATGLDAAGLKEALQAGSTVAQLIEANGGDVATVSAALVAQASARLTEMKEASLAELPSLITEQLNRSWQKTFFRRQPRHFARFGGGALLQEATGLDAAALKEALQAGSTVAQLIEANGGDVETVSADLLAQATATINDLASDKIDGLEEAITDKLNASYSDAGRRRGKFGRRPGRMPKAFG